jgi:hypothetical protein
VSSIENIVAQLARHQRVGDYAGAAKYAGSLDTSLQCHPAVALQISRGLTRQGYAARACEALESVVGDAGNWEERQLARLELAFLSVFRERRIRAARAEGETLFHELESRSNDAVCLAAAYNVVGRLVLVCAIYHEASSERCSEALANIVNAAMVLHENGRSDEAFSAQLVRARHLASDRERLEALDQLLAEAQAKGHPVSGEVALERARVLRRQGALRLNRR